MLPRDVRNINVCYDRSVNVYSPCAGNRWLHMYSKFPKDLAESSTIAPIGLQGILLMYWQIDQYTLDQNSFAPRPKNVHICFKFNVPDQTKPKAVLFQNVFDGGKSLYKYYQDVSIIDMVICQVKFRRHEYLMYAGRITAI
jgi:hypothetical protein